MSSTIGAKRNVKIFVLYLLQNINYPLELCTISDIVMQTDYVLFLDFAESFNEMTDAGLIASVESEGRTLYYVTDHGRTVAQSLRSDVLSSMLDKAMSAALRYLDFSRRGVVCSSEIIRRDQKTGACDVHCVITEQKKVIFEATLHADSEDRARRMKENFDSRPEVIYRGYTALLAGDVNYLFEKDGKK